LYFEWKLNIAVEIFCNWALETWNL